VLIYYPASHAVKEETYGVKLISYGEFKIGLEHNENKNIKMINPGLN
jgi:hypothetical protein